MPVAPEPVPATLPLVVVAHDDPGTADALRHAVETAGFRVAVAQPGPAGLAAALAAGPAVALVGCAVLADLPAGCAVPVLALGDDDRPADLRAALQAGAVGMLAWPDGAADLPDELARAAGAGRPQAPGGGALVVAARGVHGGAGTTTVAVHLAAAWARWGSAPVLLVDLAGGLGFRLDLGGAPSWSTLAAAGGPIDGVGLAAAVAEPWTGLAVLPLAGLADGTPEPGTHYSGPRRWCCRPAWRQSGRSIGATPRPLYRGPAAASRSATATTSTSGRRRSSATR
jgi:CheY-like chemotaxis protein